MARFSVSSNIGQAKDWKPYLKVDIGRPKDGVSTEFLIGIYEIIIADRKKLL